MTTATPSPLARFFYWDKNSWIHLLLLLITAVCFAQFAWLGLLVYPLMRLLSDLLYYVFAVQIFDPSITIQRGYRISLDFNDSAFGQGLDYRFNFYNGNFKKTRTQAQQDKFEYVYQQLGLQAGMRLIDVGCGCGDWLSFLKNRGVEVEGINITWDQVAVCRGRGLNVHWHDWKEISTDPTLQSDLYGKFDRVTFWDTVEHYAPLKYNFNAEQQDKIYRQMFEFAHSLLKDKEHTKIFISCLHTRFRFKDMKPSWALAKKSFLCLYAG